MICCFDYSTSAAHAQSKTCGLRVCLAECIIKKNDSSVTEEITTNERRLAAAVDAWAQEHRSEMIRDIITLVNIRSVTGEAGCREAAEQLLRMAHGYGFAGETHEELSVSIVHPGCGSTRELGILGHLDVVPEGTCWRYAPYDAVEKDGYVIGRGASDNKGPVVMSLYVLRCLREMNIPLQSSIRLIAGCREETDMLDVQRYLQTHRPPTYTLNCDGAWPGCIGEKGILEADLTIPAGDGLISLSGGTSVNTVPDHACAVLADCPEGTAVHACGKAAHCCVPHQGENAISKLLNQLCDSGLLTGETYTALDSLRQCFADDYGTGLRIHHEDSLSKTTCVPTMISLQNGVIRLHFNARTALTQRLDMIRHTLEKRLSRLNIHLENLRWVPPRYDSPDQPEIRLLLDTCRTVLNTRAKPYVMGGGTHSRYFPRSLPFGPGVLDPRIKRPFGKAHGPDEAVCVDDLLRAIKVYVIALKRLDNYFEQQNPESD